MHQQVRVLIRTARSDADREMLVERNLVDILSLLSRTNLRSAGRAHSDRGEEFVFSVQHAEGDNKADENARDILLRKHYEATLVPVEHDVLPHRQGALLACIRRVEAARDEPVIEVYIGAAEPDGRIPVQLVTAKMLNP